MKLPRLNTNRLAALLLAGLCLNGMARTWYLSPAGDDSAGGTSWEDALASPQVALDQAQPGDQLWLAAGTYRPTAIKPGCEDTPYTSSFFIKDGVSIYGGFLGNETSLNQRSTTGAAWDFEHETVLAGSTEAPGSVLRPDSSDFAYTTTFDGITICGGTALGRDELGRGGGIYLPANATLQNCIVEGNLARNGGGIAANGSSTIRRCLVSDNDLTTEGWNGEGGGIRCYGNNTLIHHCVVAHNGESGGARNGGGIHLGSQSTVDHCTIVHNTAPRRGCGIYGADSGCTVRNSIIWGNSGASMQASLNSTSVVACAIQGLYMGEDSIPLEADNAGPNGIDSNDNWVDGYYVCFQNPDDRDYRLAPGSYAINRGVNLDYATDACQSARSQKLLPDMGAYESPYPGNLAVDFELEFPCTYQYDSAAMPILGLASPDINQISFSDPDGLATWTQSQDGWSARWLAARQVHPVLTAQVAGDNAAAWHLTTISRSLDVAPRALVITANDQEWTYGDNMPELTYSVLTGELASADSMTGQLLCEIEDVLDTAYPIRQGTLNVDDGDGGANYDIHFLDGELLYKKAETTISITAATADYSGFSQAPDINTETAVAELDVTYTGTGDTAYGPSSVPPTDTGSYTVTITVRDPHYCGNTETTYTILPVTLSCTAQTSSRMYAMPNPDWTITFTGFVGNDCLDDITPPTASCSATTDSLPGDYPITVTGGYARNYTLQCTDGKLRITKASLTATPVCSPLAYGATLDEATLSGQATHSGTGQPVPGHYEWENGEALLTAGSHTQTWYFIPDDTTCFATASGEITVAVALRELRLKLHDKTQLYGNPEQPLTYEIQEGTLLAGDSFSGELQREPGTDTGNYAITLGTLVVNGNYLLSADEASYEITPRRITLKMLDASKEYNEADPALTYDIGEDGLAPSSTLTGAPSRQNGETPGTYTIDRGTLALNDEANYTVTIVQGTFTITKAQLFINDTVSGGEITFGYTLRYATIQNVTVFNKQGQEVSGSLEWQDTTWMPPNVGTHNPDWIFTPQNSDCYQPLTGQGIVLVTKKYVAIAINTARKEYGQPDPAFSYTISDTALVGNSVITGTPERTPGESCGMYSINQGTLHISDEENYDLEVRSGSFYIDKGTPIPSSNLTSSPIYYGQTLYNASFINDTATNASGEEVTGRFYWKNSGKILPAGEYEEEWIFLPSSSEYNNIEGKSSVVVTQRDITFTLKNNSKAYGTEDPELTYTIGGKGLANKSTVSGSPERDPGEEPGTYPIGRGSLAISDEENYSISVVDAVFTITKASLTISASPTASAILYGDALEASTLTPVQVNSVAGETVDGSFEWNEPETVLAAGTHTPEWTFTPDDQDHYLTASGTSELTVNKRQLTLKMCNATKQFGSEDPVLDYEIQEDGLAQTSTISGTPTRAPGETVGTYTIDGNAIAINDGENYDITCIPATLSIVKATMHVPQGLTATPITYGDLLSQATFSDVTVTNLNDQVVEGSFVWEKPDLALPAGTHAQNWLFVPDDTNNNETLNGVLTVQVNQRAVTIQLDDKSMYNNDATMPAPTYTIVTGTLLPGDTIDGEGGYDGTQIVQNTLAINNVNYTLTVLQGTLTVIQNPQILTITKTGTAPFGTPLKDIELEGYCTLEKTGETVPGQLEWTNPQLNTIAPGNASQSVTFTPDDTSRFTTVTTTAALVITKGRLVVKANTYYLEYGKSLPLYYDYTIVEGIVPEEGYGPWGLLTYKNYVYPLTPGSKIPIVNLTLHGGNYYDIEYIEDYIIGVQGHFTVQATDCTKVQGQEDPEFTYTITDGTLYYKEKITGTLTREPGEIPGEYTISGENLVYPQFYDVTFIPGKLTITEPTRGAADNKTSAGSVGQTHDTERCDSILLHAATDQENQDNASLDTIENALLNLADNGTLLLETGEYGSDDQTIDILRPVTIMAASPTDCPVIHGTIRFIGENASGSCLKGLDILGNQSPALLLLDSASELLVENTLLQGDPLVLSAQNHRAIRLNGCKLQSANTGCIFKEAPQEEELQDIQQILQDNLFDTATPIQWPGQYHED